jgi:predicted house-cleaning noncanonical NTP pyrophosphatase (MazG superfamily)
MSLKRKFIFNKLIRDKLPAIFRSEGIEISSKILENDADYLKSLKDKLMEEAQEAVEATTELHMQEELADVLEAIRALCLACGFTYEKVEALRQQKREAKGSYETRVYANFIEIGTDHPRIDYYLSKPKEYPEIS